MLLRIAKRRTSIEQGREQFIRLEFYRAGQPDLRVSVYEVTESDIVRVRTEHYAGEGLDPRGGPCWDVGQLVATHPIVVPGSNPHFAFAREVHRELPFEGEVDLERFANELFTRSQQLTYEVAKGDMKNWLFVF